MNIKSTKMELTIDELQTIKDCLDNTLTQLGDKSNLRGKICKLLDRLEDFKLD